MLKLFLGLGASAAVAVGAFHLELKSSIPMKDQTVPVSPAKVSLTFSEAVDFKLAAISILRPDSTEVAKLTVAGTKDPRTIEGAVSAKLAPGSYLVRWKAASDDGHVVRQAYAFSVAAPK